MIALFAIAAWPFRYLGTIKSPALGKLDKLDHAIDFAIVGDSRAHVALSPSTLTQGFAAAGLPGHAGFNFAVDGSDALHHFSFILRGLLDQKASARPRVIVWAPNPLSFDMTRTNNRLQQLSTRDIKALLFAGAPLEVLLDLATGGVYAPYRHRPEVRGYVEDVAEATELRLAKLQPKLLGLDYEVRPKPRKYLEQPDGHDPFVTVADWAERFERGLTSYRVSYEKLQVSEWHLSIARALMRRCKERGTQLVILELPVSPTYQRELASLRKHREWQRRMQELAEAEGAIWIADNARLAADTMFGDPAHMDLLSAMPYSADLAARLAANPVVRDALTKRPEH